MLKEIVKKELVEVEIDVCLYESILMLLFEGDRDCFSEAELFQCPLLQHVSSSNRLSIKRMLNAPILSKKKEDGRYYATGVGLVFFAKNLPMMKAKLGRIWEENPSLMQEIFRLEIKGYNQPIGRAKSSRFDRKVLREGINMIFMHSWDYDPTFAFRNVLSKLERAKDN